MASHAQFRLSTQTIVATGSRCPCCLAASDQPDAILWRACRDASRARLDDLAQRLEPAAGWDELVLPEAQKIILRQIAAHARHRLTVYQKWGFAAKGARGLGISALFAGESGTGKTMAAEVLAHKLHLDLYRIDLASVVSKYIGDTEKNLRRVFDAAEESGAILLFDEADALFGKRSEVRDSHDRYANIEVSYLLQRMEAYRGLAILTTNMKAALDVAFQRRLSFVVHFPFPDQQQRELIWRGVFPAATPVERSITPNSPGSACPAATFATSRSTPPSSPRRQARRFVCCICSRRRTAKRPNANGLYPTGKPEGGCEARRRWRSSKFKVQRKTGFRPVRHSGMDCRIQVTWMWRSEN